MPATPPVSVDEYRHALQRLLVSWKTQAAKGIEVRTEHTSVITLVYPWVAQVHRFGRAYLVMEKAGFAHESHAMVRSALEYAVLAHWVAVTGDAGVASRYERDYHALALLLDEAKGRPGDVVPSGWDLELLEQLVDMRAPSEGDDEQKVVQQVNQVCQKLGLGSTLYPACRILSWYAHPTTHSTPVYMVSQDDGTLALRDQAASPSANATVAMLTHCVYWARRVLDDMTVGRSYARWLDEIAESIQVRPRLPDPRDTGVSG